MSTLKGCATDIIFHPLLEGLEKFILKASPQVYCLSPSFPQLTHSFLYLTSLIYASVPFKHHLCMQNPKLSAWKNLLLLHSLLVKFAYFRNRRKTYFPDFMNVILFHRHQHFGKKILLDIVNINFYCFKNCYAAVKNYLDYQHTQQIVTLSIYTSLPSSLLLFTYILMLKTDLVDCKAFQGTFLAGIKANAISTKLHYNPLKLTASH